MLILFASGIGYTQEDFFNEVLIEHEFKTESSYVPGVWAHYKHAYQNSKWRRFGATAFVDKALGTNWELHGALTYNYTFNKELGDFYEIRPRFGIALRTPIYERLTFNQRALVEWRNFFLNRFDHYIRFRYRIGLAYSLADPATSLDNWRFATSFEWYILRDPLVRERYPNHREFFILVTKRFGNSRVGLGYKREKFLLNNHGLREHGNTFVLRFNR